MKNRNAFTILELAIALVVIGTLLGSAFYGYNALVVNANEVSQRDKMQTVQKAISVYWKSKGTLPCPAQQNLTVGNANYGVAVSSCTSSCVAGITCSTNLAVGMLPYKTLGLTLESITDIGNNLLIYTVDSRATLRKCELPGFLTILDATGNTVTSKASYVVLAKNKDGCSTGLDQGNCSNGSSFVLTTKNAFNPTLYFDHNILFEANINAKSCFANRSDCALWLDASDSCAISASGTSFQFYDKSVNSSDFSKSTSSLPTLGSASPQNGFNYVSFNGSGELDNTTLVLKSTGWTMIFAVRATSYTGTLFAYASQINSNPKFAVYMDVSLTNKLSIFESNTTFTSSTKIIDNTPHIITASYDPATGYKLYLDGSKVITDSNTGAVNSGLKGFLGMHNNFGGYNGDIFEVALFDSFLDDANRTFVEAQVANRWGISY